MKQYKEPNYSLLMLKRLPKIIDKMNPVERIITLELMVHYQNPSHSDVMTTTLHQLYKRCHVRKSKILQCLESLSANYGDFFCYKRTPEGIYMYTNLI